MFGYYVIKTLLSSKLHRKKREAFHIIHHEVRLNALGAHKILVIKLLHVVFLTGLIYMLVYPFGPVFYSYCSL